MPFYCTDGCGEHRPAGGLTQPCPRCGSHSAERIPPLDGFLWFGRDDDAEAKQRMNAYFDLKRRTV